jgi:ribonuclease-3
MWSPNWERAETDDDPAGPGGAKDGAPGARGAPAGSEPSGSAPGHVDPDGRGAATRHVAPALKALARRIDWEFRDEGVLVQAMSHRSWCAEAGAVPSNERLEFLGDAVLGLVVAEHCYLAYPGLPEGSLAKVRAAVVNTAVLAEVAAELDLGPALLLGRGEDVSGGRNKPSILANAVEAVIGAVYLDGGWDVASRVVLDILGDRIEQAAAGPGAEDFKTRLQEVVLRRIGELPRYEVEGTGPDHARRYRASVLVAGAERGVGEGRSKKDAEQAAARVAWAVLVERDGDALAENVGGPGAPADLEAAPAEQKVGDGA